MGREYVTETMTGCPQAQRSFPDVAMGLDPHPEVG
jgi:hypothetical protein